MSGGPMDGEDHYHQGTAVPPDSLTFTIQTNDCRYGKQITYVRTDAPDTKGGPVMYEYEPDEGP